MTTYRDITNQVADQWVAALKNAEQFVGVASSGAQRMAGAVPIPAPFQELNEVVAGKLPEPRELVEANFDFTSRLLTAQRDLTLKLLEANTAKTASNEAKDAPASPAEEG